MNIKQFEFAKKKAGVMWQFMNIKSRWQKNLMKQ